MKNSFKPASADQLHDVIGWAAAEGATLDVVGRGTKQGLGRPSQSEYLLDLSDLSGITSYEPEELVLQAAAGTPVVEIERAVAEKDQQLAFEPADYGPLFGATANSASIGGTFACNLSGATSDHGRRRARSFAGCQGGVGPRRAIQKRRPGRKKTSRGYDLCKLLAGSYGTLAAIHDVTLKVMPAPEKVRTVLVLGLDDAGAVGLLGEAAASGFELSGLAHLPPEISCHSSVSYVADAATSVTALRLEGPGPSVEHRCEGLKKWVAARAPVEELHRHNSAALWREVRDVAAFAVDGLTSHSIWRLSVPPASGADVVGKIVEIVPARWLFDWAGGLLWLATDAAPADNEAPIRAAVTGVGGHATLVRAPTDARAAVPVFQPQSPPLAELSRRVKENFDPKGILNPGRMYPGV